MNRPGIMPDGLAMSLLINAAAGPGFPLAPRACGTMFPKEIRRAAARLRTGRNGCRSRRFLSAVRRERRSFAPSRGAVAGGQRDPRIMREAEENVAEV